MSARKIDHLVLPVASLDGARSRLSALGFTVAADAYHPFGTANACVFLEDGIYLEPLAISDRRKAGSAAKRGNVFTDRDLAFRGRRGRQGLSAMAVSTDDAAADHQRYLASGISAGEPLEFARAVTSPGGEVKEASFRLAFAAAEGAPNFFAFSCQRVVSLPQDLDALRLHSNAVSGIKEVVMTGEGSVAEAALLEQVIGAPAVFGDSEMRVAAANAGLRIIDAGRLQHEFGTGVEPMATGLFAQAIIFQTADLAVTEITLAANDVAFIRRDGRVLVAPAPGQGVLFGFEE